LSSLSLSLTSLLSRPVSIQGSGVESPDPTRIGEGARVHLSEEASPGGRGRLLRFSGFRPTPLALARGRGFIYRRRRPLQEGGALLASFRGVAQSPRGCTASGGGKLHNDAGWRRHGARSFFWLASTVSGPYPFGSFRRTDSRASAGPASADTLLRGHSMSPNSGCLNRELTGHDSGNSVVP
jgi:hypothetical protein